MAALTAIPADIYAESATDCGSLIHSPGAEDIEHCRGPLLDLYVGRLLLVSKLALLGLALTIVAVVGLHRSRPLPGSRAYLSQSWWSLPVVVALGLLSPFIGFPLLVLAAALGGGDTFAAGDLLHRWYGLGLAAELLLVAALAASLGRRKADRVSPFVANFGPAMCAIALPLMAAIQIEGGTNFDLFIYRGDYPAWNDDPGSFGRSGLAVTILLVLGWILQKHGWRFPPAHVSIGLLLGSAACLSLMFTPEFVPGWQPAPKSGDAALLALLWVPLAINTLVVFLYPRESPPPAAGMTDRYALRRKALR